MSMSQGVAQGFLGDVEEVSCRDIVFDHDGGFAVEGTFHSRLKSHPLHQIGQSRRETL